MSTTSSAADSQSQPSLLESPPQQVHGECSKCGSADLHMTSARSAFWAGERLVVVEEIPTIVCASCQEQHYDDTTVVLLDLLRGDGFPPEKAAREITVPVFSLSERTKAGA
jgi:YgiT-type zinc finger domain-containing protein